MKRPPWGAGALVIAGFLFVRPAAALPRVAIVTSGQSDPKGHEIETQLRAELVTAGFEVLTVTDPSAANGSAGTSATLDRVAEQTGSVAAISLVQLPGASPAEVWITDRVTGKTLLRRVRSEASGEPSPAIFALRAVELLRASMLELNEAHPMRGSVAPPATLRAWVEPSKGEVPPPVEKEPEVEPSRFALGAGGSMLAGPGGLPATFAPSLSLMWKPTRVLGLQLRGVGPAVSSFYADVGSAAVHEELVTLDLRVMFFRHPRWVSPFVGVGAGVLHVGAKGSPGSDRYLASSGQAWSAIFMGGFGLRFPVSNQLAFLAAGDVAYAAPRPVIAFADQSRVFAGRPEAITSAGLELGW